MIHKHGPKISSLLTTVASAWNFSPSHYSHPLLVGCNSLSLNLHFTFSEQPSVTAAPQHTASCVSSHSTPFLLCNSYHSHSGFFNCDAINIWGNIISCRGREEAILRILGYLAASKVSIHYMLITIFPQSCDLDICPLGEKGGDCPQLRTSAFLLCKCFSSSLFSTPFHVWLCHH